MTKRKADDDNIWFVLEEDGGLKSIVKSKKNVVIDEDETIVEYEDSALVQENDEEVDDPGGVDNQAVGASVAFEGDDVDEEEYYEVYEEENGGEASNDVENRIAKPTTQLIVQNLDSEALDDQEQSKFGCGSSWTDQAVVTMLNLVEPALAEFKMMPPQKHRELWDRIAESLAPHQHSGMDCLLKFRNMKRAYKKLLLRKARNLPIQWKYFDRMHSLLQCEMPSASLTRNEDGEPRAGPSKDDDLQDGRPSSKFDRFLNHKQEILEEVRSQGAVVKRHLEEMALSNDRRERKENEIYTLLKTIVSEEEKKVDLFRKLLERLWSVLHNHFVEMRIAFKKSNKISSLEIDV